jgi:hypothetical protein
VLILLKESLNLAHVHIWLYDLVMALLLKSRVFEGN